MKFNCVYEENFVSISRVSTYKFYLYLQGVHL
jgi:hypothetical protein